MIHVKDIECLPIVMRLIIEFRRTRHTMRIVEAERIDEKRVRVVIEIDMPPKVIN